MRVENEDKINVDIETDYKFDINKKNEKGKENCVNEIYVDTFCIRFNFVLK